MSEEDEKELPSTVTILVRPEQSKLLQLVDAQNLLKEEISLASFTTGFKLAWGMAQELWADGPYSFDEEQMG